MKGNLMIAMRRPRIRWVLACLGLVLSLGLGWGGLRTPAATRPELRGVWLTTVDSTVLSDPAALTKGMETLARLNFNTVYPSLWNDGFTLYPSDKAQELVGQLQNPKDEFKGRDVLAELIAQGHPKRLRIIPWFEFGYMIPESSLLAQQHPEWLTTRKDRSTVWIEEGSIEKFRRVWLNPFHPDVQKLLLSMVTELFTQYDVDGIQFDDHIGIPKDYGYDDYTESLYRLENAGADPPENASDPSWIKWRADRITEFMQRVHEAIHTSTPKCRASVASCVLSVAPNPYTFSYQNYLQDWDAWRRNKTIDELVVQVYGAGKGFQDEISNAYVRSAQQEIPVSIGILSGLKNRSRPITTIQKQVWQVRNRGLDGVSFFFYESLQNWAKEDPEAREAGFRSLFRTLTSAPIRNL